MGTTIVIIDRLPAMQELAGVGSWVVFTNAGNTESRESEVKRILKAACLKKGKRKYG